MSSCRGTGFLARKCGNIEKGLLNILLVDEVFGRGRN